MILFPFKLLKTIPDRENILFVFISTDVVTSLSIVYPSFPVFQKQNVILNDKTANTVIY